MAWLEKFASNVLSMVGGKVREQVMEGRDSLTAGSPPQVVASWVGNAVGKLEQVAGIETASGIMSACSCQFPRWRIQQLETAYQESGDLSSIIKFMSSNPELYGKITKRADKLYVTRLPHRPRKYQESATPSEKRQHYCRCPMVKFYQGKLPESFCCCGGGWFRQVWEGVLGHPVDVKLQKSVMQGYKECKFICSIGGTVS